jgi:Mn2+/Fe2+ NRAMP family transporter
VFHSAFVFFATALLTVPQLGDIMSGMFVPQLPEGAELTALALIGTTIVPYNLFLHAAVVRERWSGVEDLTAVRWDLILAIGLGGIVSAAVVVTASAALDGADVRSASDMAEQLRPLLGPWAGHAFAVGYAAAGITSAVTAPLAAAYTLLDALGHRRDVRTPLARSVWAGCIFVGAGTALIGFRPVPLIVLAQLVNGLVLPIVAVVLLIAMNDRTRLGDNVNGWCGNLVGAAVAILCIVLGMRAIVFAL